jgi:hypothetical protein
MGSVGQLDPDQKLSDGDRSKGDLVIVVDGMVQRCSLPVSVDKVGGVEEEPAQGRVSISRSSRTEAMSRAKLRSGLCRCSTALTSAPRPVLTGSNCATTLPRLTIVNRSPRCSTASSMSEKFLAASVALTSGTKSDYQIYAGTSDRADCDGLPDDALLIENRRENTDGRLNRQPQRATQQLSHRHRLEIQKVESWMALRDLDHPRHGRSRVRKHDVMAQFQKAQDGPLLLILLQLLERSGQVTARSQHRRPAGPVVPVEGRVQGNSPSLRQADQQLLDQQPVIDYDRPGGRGHPTY